MKSKQQRQEELRVILAKADKEEIPLGKHKVEWVSYGRPKNPHVKAAHFVTDTCYSDKSKNSPRIKKIKKNFKKRLALMAPVGKKK